MGALGGPGDALHHVLVLPQLGFALLRGDHPHAHRLVIGAAGEQRAVLVGTDHPHPLPVACERLHTVPAEGSVTGCKSRRHQDTRKRTQQISWIQQRCKTRGSGSLLPSGHLPHLNGLVSGGRHYVVPVWHDGNRRHVVVMAWATRSRV